MRIISGKYAKRRLLTLKSQKTRPTSDKVKESLFDSLGQYFSGGEVLDLYAGSGALGIEAVSRGCDHAVLVDINHAAVNVIRQNVMLTKETDKFKVLKMSDQQALKLLTAKAVKFDLVFLDPPYAKQKISDVMKKLDDFDLLASDSRIIAETDDRTDLSVISDFELLKTHHLGKTIVRIYRKEKA